MRSDIVAGPVVSASDLAAANLSRLQGSDGAWEGEVVWCPIITAQVVILNVIANKSITEERRRLLLKQFEVTRRSDGGWGLHPESHSYRFVTTLVYVAARLLGEPTHSAMLAGARAFLNQAPGGVFSLPQWGKVWLSFIGLFDTRALKPLPPEVFLLPHWAPVSPQRFYCHTRYIYLAMSYLVGSGFCVDIGPISADLRRELYGNARQEDAVWHRHDLASSDAYVRPGPALVLLYDVMSAFSRIARYLPGTTRIRRRALDACMKQVIFEQRATNYQGLSPVSGILNALVLHASDPEGEDARRSFEGIESWRWDDEHSGSRYSGARSTTWDTSFAVQALLAGGHEKSLKQVETLRRGYRRLVEMQIKSELNGGSEHARDTILGGWCVSDGTHRWPVSDCAAEAIISLLDCHNVPGLIPDGDRLPQTRLDQAAAFILSRQNADGGFGSYERRRGARFLEKLNPSEMFGQCMTELSYVECTGSSMRALIRLMRNGVNVPASRLKYAIDRGANVILDRQRENGSWPGFWGINFIYGSHFAAAALREAGMPADHSALRSAARWLKSVQHADGGWGEHFSGCLNDTFVDNPDSLISSTAWACLALMHAESTISPELERGIDYLIDRQIEGGGFPRETANGVFFGTAMLEYALYNSYFPAMALAQFDRLRNGRH